MNPHPSDKAVADLIRHARLGAATNQYPGRTRTVGAYGVRQCSAGRLVAEAIRADQSVPENVARARSSAPTTTPTRATSSACTSLPARPVYWPRRWCAKCSASTPSHRSSTPTGAPTSKPLATLQADLEVTRSHSRPKVSNDSPTPGPGSCPSNTPRSSRSDSGARDSTRKGAMSDSALQLRPECRSGLLACRYALTGLELRTL